MSEEMDYSWFGSNWLDKSNSFNWPTDKSKSGCVSINNADGTKTTICGTSTCTDECVAALKTKVAAVNAEVTASRAVNKTELTAAETKYQAAKKAALAKLTKAEVTACNAKCK
jgi:hypothetical protein